MKKKINLTKAQRALSIKSLNRAIIHVGNVSALAKQMKVTVQVIYIWLNGGSNLPILRAMQIEKITNGTITKEQLRPDLL